MAGGADVSGKAVGVAFGVNGISPTDKLVFVAYANFADTDGKNIYPAIQTIAEITGLSDRTVQRSTKKLQEKEYIIADGKGPKGTNKWRIDMALGGDTVSYVDGLRVTPTTQRGDTDDRGGDTDDTLLGDIAVSPEPLTVKEPSLTHTEWLKMSSVDMQNRVREDKFLQAMKGIDFSDYPEDTREILIDFCIMWTMRTPTTKSDKAEWIESARALIGACGEFGIDALRSYRREYEDYMKNHNGLAPFTVSSPRSLVRTVTGHAATMRDKKYLAGSGDMARGHVRQDGSVNV